MHQRNEVPPQQPMPLPQSSAGHARTVVANARGCRDPSHAPTPVGLRHWSPGHTSPTRATVHRVLRRPPQRPALHLPPAPMPCTFSAKATDVEVGRHQLRPAPHLARRRMRQAQTDRGADAAGRPPSSGLRRHAWRQCARSRAATTGQRRGPRDHVLPAWSWHGVPTVGRRRRGAESASLTPSRRTITSAASSQTTSAHLTVYLGRELER